MNRSFFAGALLALLSFITAGRAEDYIILDQRADEFDNWQDRVDQTYGTTVISREFNVPVVVLEEQRTRSHLGYGGLMIANALAVETGRSFDEIVALKSSGHGWGRIAHDNNVKLGPIVSRLNRADGEFRQVKVKNKNGQAKIKVKEAKGGRDWDKHNRGHGQGKGKAKGHGKGNGGGKGKHK